MHFRQASELLMLAEAIGAAVAAMRLVHFRMWPRFRLLIAYLAMASACPMTLSLFSQKSKPYFWIFLIWSPVQCVMAAFAVRQIFSVVFREYPGLKTAGRWAVHATLVVSVAASAVVLRGAPPQISVRSQWLYYEISFERSVAFSLALLVIAVFGRLSRYPLRLDRNTVIVGAFFGTLLLSRALVRLIDSFSPPDIAIRADYAEVAACAVLYVVWSAMLRRPNAPTAQFTTRPPEEEDLLRGLHTLNSILGRSAQT